MNPSPHWDKGGIESLRNERREKQAESIGALLTPWLDDMKDKVKVLPDHASGPKEWSLERRIADLKKDFHSEANRLAINSGKDQYYYHPDVVPILNQLVKYYVGSDCGLDPKKGILLVGNPGCGKSLIMEVFSNVLRQGETRPGGFRYKENRLGALFVEAKGLCRDFGTIKSPEGKVLFWQTYGSNLSAKEAKPQEYLPANHLTIDDLYKEEMEKAYDYGKNPIIELMNMRVKLMRWNVMTNGTSNYPIEGMANYGNPIIDRLYEMFNVIKFTNDSFR